MGNLKLGLIRVELTNWYGNPKKAKEQVKNSAQQQINSHHCYISRLQIFVSGLPTNCIRSKNKIGHASQKNVTYFVYSKDDQMETFLTDAADFSLALPDGPNEGS